MNAPALRSEGAALHITDTRARIITSYYAPPIPDRRFDWSAWRDGNEEGPVGYGKSEAEAIEDLTSNHEDDDMPERFKCSGCGDEMSENDFLAFNELCRGCEYERAAEEAADQRSER